MHRRSGDPEMVEWKRKGRIALTEEKGQFYKERRAS